MTGQARHQGQDTTEGWLEDRGYKNMNHTFMGLDVWESPKGQRITYAQACRRVFGSCACCDQPNVYIGATRCGAQCSYDHGLFQCTCYKDTDRQTILPSPG